VENPCKTTYTCRLFLPSLGRQATTVYSGRGGRHSYEIKWFINANGFHFGGWVARADTFYDLKSGLATIPISSWRIAREGLFF
jgi:hypothetical protein